MSVELVNYIDVAGAMANLVALEEEITTAVGQILQLPFGADRSAYPFMRYEARGVYPKWLNGISTAKPDEFGIWEDAEPVVIQTLLQLGTETEGADGTLEQQLYTWIPYTMAIARSRPLLTSDARPEKPKFMLGAAMRLDNPLMPGGIIAARFLWTLSFYVTNVERDY